MLLLFSFSIITNINHVNTNRGTDNDIVIMKIIIMRTKNNDHNDNNVSNNKITTTKVIYHNKNNNKSKEKQWKKIRMLIRMITKINKNHHFSGNHEK